jgi:hypothetical protein
MRDVQEPEARTGMTRGRLKPKGFGIRSQGNIGRYRFATMKTVARQCSLCCNDTLMQGEVGGIRRR